FNSRTREGCDLIILDEAGDLQYVSIHAPGRGATDRFNHVGIAPKFQFTHPGGVRQYGAKLRIMGRINKRNLRLEVLL
ncbi:hypothetical protein HMPREF3185_02146, partial [Porphyromonas somerae]